MASAFLCSLRHAINIILNSESLNHYILYHRPAGQIISTISQSTASSCLTLNVMFGQGKTKRRKVECSVCHMTFDSDYRKKHNEKYHSEMTKARRHIPYKLVGAIDSPFAFAQQKPKTTIPETGTVSEESTSTEPQSQTCSKPEEESSQSTSNVAVLTPKPPPSVPQRDESSAVDDDTDDTMAEKTNGGENEESNESEITVWPHHLANIQLILRTIGTLT